MGDSWPKLCNILGFIFLFSHALWTDDRRESVARNQSRDLYITLSPLPLRRRLTNHTTSSSCAHSRETLPYLDMRYAQAITRAPCASQLHRPRHVSRSILLLFDGRIPASRGPRFLSSSGQRPRLSFLFQENGSYHHLCRADTLGYAESRLGGKAPSSSDRQEAQFSTSPGPRPPRTSFLQS